MLQVLVPLAVAAFIIMIVTSLVSSVAVNSLENLPDTGETIEQLVTSSGFENPDSLNATSFITGHPETDANDDNNASYWQAVLSNSTSVYLDSTSSTGLTVNNDRPLVGIYVNSSSTLIDQPINEIDLNLRAVGTPTQPAQVGVFQTVTTTEEITDPNGTTTTAVSTSDGVPALVVDSGDETIIINNGDAVGERAHEKQSLLYGYPVTAVNDVRLAKTGTPYGDVFISVLNSSGLPDETYATVDVSQLSTSTFASYGGTGNEEFVDLGEVVGIYYDGTGSQTAGSIATVTESASQLTGTSLVSLSGAGSTIIGERADTGSALIGDTINALEVRILKQDAVMSGTVTLGVFDASGNTDYTFCTFDASRLTLSQTQVVCINEDASHTIALGDRIGVKYAGGDGTHQVQLATSGSNPFDGTASYRETFASGSWTASTGSDLRFRATLTDVDASANYSIDLDGSTGHVSTGDIALIANNTSTTSIFAAISPDVSKTQAILSSRHITATEGAGFSLNDNDNLVFQFYPVDGSGLQTFTDSRNVTIGTFQTVGVIFNGTHATFCIERSCVVDDNVISSKTIEVSDDNYWRIGHREQAGASNERFDGKIDDVLVYSVAKTVAQAINIQEGVDDYVGLTHRWDFNAGTDNYHPDEIGSADGIVSGTVTYADGYGVGSYVRIRVSDEAISGAFDRTADDTRTSYSEYNRETGSWSTDATRDMKQTITGTTRSPASVIDEDLNSFWVNNNPNNPESVNSTSGVLDYSKLIGANFDDYVLKQKGNQPIRVSPDQSWYDEHFALMREHHFTVARVPYNWEAYEKNPTNFVLSLQRIAQAAEDNHIMIFLDHHHFYISGWLDYPDKSESGFPLFVVQNYQDQTDCYESSSVVKQNGVDICTTDDGEIFWDDFWTNNVDYNGTNVWQDMADFEKVVINTVDDYDSVIGYEILNEPHFWKTEHYAQAGNFYDFMYHELREVTNKDIHITRETPHGDGSFTRSPSQEHNIFPTPGDDVFGLVYQPHHYNTNTFQSQINSVVNTIIPDLIEDGHDPEIAHRVIWGEFGMGAPSQDCAANGNDPTTECQTGMNTWISKMEDAGHGFTFWKWNLINGGETDGRTLIRSDTNDAPTTPFMVLKAMDVAIAANYDLNELDQVAEDGFSTQTVTTGGTTTDSIYLNFTNAFSINHVTLKHRNADFVPDDVCIYVSNSTSNWGTANECVSLTATANNQTITVSPAEVGKFVRVVPGAFQEGRFWQLSMVDAGQVPPNPTVTVETTFEIIPIKIFGTVQPDILTSSFTSVTSALIGDSHTISAGDFIGIYYTEDNGSNNIEVMTDTTASDPDGTATMLMYVENNATSFFNTQDLTGELRLAEHVDLPSIYADLGDEETNIDGLRIYKSNASNLPASVDIYVGNITSELGGEETEGAFTLIAHDQAITQSTGTQTIDLPDDTYGRYVLIQVNDADSATLIDLAEFDIEILTSETEEVEVPGDASWADSVEYLSVIFTTAMIIMILAIIIIAFKTVTDN